MTSLSALRPGQSGTIARIPLDSVRRHCSAVGLETGDRVLCRGSSAHVILLRTAKRTTIVLEHDLARWIEVTPALRTQPPAARTTAAADLRHRPGTGGPSATGPADVATRRAGPAAAGAAAT